MQQYVLLAQLLGPFMSCVLKLWAPDKSSSYWRHIWTQNYQSRLKEAIWVSGSREQRMLTLCDTFEVIRNHV